MNYIFRYSILVLTVLYFLLLFPVYLPKRFMTKFVYAYNLCMSEYIDNGL